MTKFKFIDLFAGIGGFHIALSEVGGECVFASEIDEKARETYRANHGMTPFGDIRAITSPDRSEGMIRKHIPDHDILAAGFPCQPFSLAGVSARNAMGRPHGLLDEAQGTLFYDIARIVSAKRPKALLLENVSNIVRHDKGRTFEVLKSVINQLGYTLSYKIISAETVVPQKRKRCFMVAFRDGENDGEFEFPEFSGDPLPLRSVLEDNVDDIYTLSDRGWSGHKRRTAANLKRGVGFTAFEADLNKPSNTIVARYYKDGKECLIPQEGKNPRLLTPRECARLQGFPEWFQPHPTRSAAYKQFGNAVPVPVVSELAKLILHHLRSQNDCDLVSEKEAIGQ